MGRHDEGKIDINPVEDLQVKIYSKMSFAQKLKLMSELRDIAWNLKMARLRSQHPEWPETQIQDEVRRIFLHGST